MKDIKWNSKAKAFVKELDDKTKKEIGSFLLLIQFGYKPGEPQVKPMKCIHQNAFEFRIKDRKGSYRIIYVLNIGDLILIPHAFTKKTQKTPLREIELSISRLKELINENF